MTIGAWMRGNLTTQGYCLSDAERRELAVGLRFSTGVCLGLVVVALVLAYAMVPAAMSLVRQPVPPATTPGARDALPGTLGAPVLTAEGAKNKGIAFQISHLKCPACVNRGSPMPSFAGLGDARLQQIASFLEASKGPVKH